jgi:hypothetical protein
MARDTTDDRDRHFYSAISLVLQPYWKGHKDYCHFHDYNLSLTIASNAA